MSRILTGLMRRGLELVRGLGTQPKIRAFSHPEKRRSTPIIYYNWGEVPKKVKLVKSPSMRIIHDVQVAAGEKRLRRKESMRHRREYNFVTDMHRWSEFRRKMIYGIY